MKELRVYCLELLKYCIFSFWCVDYFWTLLECRQIPFLSRVNSRVRAGFAAEVSTILSFQCLVVQMNQPCTDHTLYSSQLLSLYLHFNHRLLWKIANSPWFQSNFDSESCSLNWQSMVFGEETQPCWIWCLSFMCARVRLCVRARVRDRENQAMLTSA